MVRLRFAPSPTGPLHIGGVRTALFNYLFAKKNNGQFILRIEDTDQTRYSENAEGYIKKSFEWLGIPFDESVEKGGKYAPYKQSERKDIYEKYIKILLENKKAYYAFDTPDELEQMRQKLQQEKSSVQHYNAITRGEMRNSFTMTETEVKQAIESGTPYVVRFDMPTDKTVELNDIIRGKISVSTSNLDDKVLFKSDGLPTYHLANIVDDHLMEITHVIRGEEWLPSLPLHVLLYEAFGWKAPEFAHLPLILKPNGKGKLSKRDGEMGGFPVFPLNWQEESDKEIIGYKEAGYMPQAVLNMLAFLGWNPATDNEVYSLDEMIELFDLTKVHKAGAKFDVEKAKWFNQQHLKKESVDVLADNFQKVVEANGVSKGISYTKQVVELVRERAVFEKDLWELSKYFFVAPTEFNPKAVKKSWKGDASNIVAELKQKLADLSDFSSQEIEKTIKNWIEQNEMGFGKVLKPLRLAIVGDTTGPDLFQIIAMIGQNETVKRIEYAIANI